MPHFDLPRGPQRIVCLTEETTEWLYLLGQEDRIVGISGYTVRPRRAREEKPKVSAFLNAKIDKILALRPDCVFGFSDLQADIAAELIRKGVAIEQAAKALPRRPKVYFEEWDEPHISAIRWVSELVGIAGGDDCFAELAAQPMGKDRIIADGAEIARRNPDIIVGSWCGKKFRPEKVAARPGWEAVNAVKNVQLFEIKSADILQPGPAALTDGVEQLHRIVMAWSKQVAPTLVAEAAALPPEGAVRALGRPGGAESP
ncbi:MAG: cobalamin-binding protein [Ramlibacter sp.]|nr:cobalamin-binding protein [Ramlibacter sp.]